MGILFGETHYNTQDEKKHAYRGGLPIVFNRDAWHHGTGVQHPNTRSQKVYGHGTV